MEVMEESSSQGSATPATRRETGGLRLRPIKTNREDESSEQPAHRDLDNNFPEETWDDEPMTPAGRVFTELNSRFVCVCILGFKERIDRQKFKSHVEATIMRHKRFCSRVETRKGKPWWTQVETNVDNHVFEAQLTPEQLADKDCVLNYTTDVVLEKPFDSSRPLWDMHLLDAKLGEAEGSCIVRIHHALGDGTSLISLLLACTRTIDKPDKLPSVPQSSPAVARSFLSKVSSAIWRFLMVCWCSVVEIGKAGATLIWMKDSSTAIKGFAGVEYSPRKYRYVTLRVDDFKYVSKTQGVTINDVFMAMAAYGLRKYLEHRAAAVKNSSSQEADATSESSIVQDKGSTGNQPEESVLKGSKGRKIKKNVDNIRVRAVALINMRASPGLQELSEMMNGHTSQARWGNHMGYMLCPLPMKRYTDPLELLHRARVIGNTKKSSLEGAFSYASGDLVMKLFGQKVAASLVYRATLQTSLSLSNVRGPTEHVMFADNQITSIIPSVVGHPHIGGMFGRYNLSKRRKEISGLSEAIPVLKKRIGLTLHLQSYNGEIYIVAMATKKLIPDLEYLLELCIDGLREMKKAAERGQTK